MSHFTSLSTRIKERAYLEAALADMGLELEDADEIIGYQGERHSVTWKIRDHSVGFAREGDTYVVVADWYVVHGLNERTFATELNRRYAYHATRGELESQGFDVIEEEQEGGEIRLVLRRMV